jgi:hypothetical protein
MMEWNFVAARGGSRRQVQNQGTEKVLKDAG